MLSFIANGFSVIDQAPFYLFQPLAKLIGLLLIDVIIGIFVHIICWYPGHPKMCVHSEVIRLSIFFTKYRVSRARVE